MAINIDTILASDIQASAKKGMWLNCASSTWNSMGKIEWLLRSILSHVPYLGVESAYHANLRYSWGAIELLPHTPMGIITDIEKTFDESIAPNNPLNRVAHVVASIYLKNTPNTVTIHEHPKLRQFDIYEGKVLQNRVLNKDWGKLDFCDPQDQLQFINEENTLYNSTRTPLGRVNVESDDQSLLDKLSHGLSSKITIYSGATTVATLKAEGDSTTFVFRDGSKIIAIAVWTPRQEKTLSHASSQQRWEFALLSRDHVQHQQLFLMALLKHSQKHMKSPNVRPYIK